MKPVKIRMNKDYATSKNHPRGKQIIMKEGMVFGSLTSFLEYSGWSSSKFYGLFERKIISYIDDRRSC